jgi:hypothetical protein
LRFAASLPVALQAYEHLVVVGVGSGWLIYHNNIQTCQSSLVLAKRLPDYSFDSISYCRSATIFL